MLGLVTRTVSRGSNRTGMGRVGGHQAWGKESEEAVPTTAHSSLDCGISPVLCCQHLACASSSPFHLLTSEHSLCVPHCLGSKV